MPTSARQRKQADRVGESQHMSLNIYTARLSSQNERRKWRRGSLYHVPGIRSTNLLRSIHFQVFFLGDETDSFFPTIIRSPRPSISTTWLEIFLYHTMKDGHMGLCVILQYKKLKNVSCDYDRLNGWNSTLLKKCPCCVFFVLLLPIHRHSAHIMPSSVCAECWFFILYYH